jgi:hypothetical protein
MKKMTVILSILLLIGTFSASGMARKPGSPAGPDTLQLKLIEPVHQHIQINCAGFNGRIYFIDDFVLSKSDVAAKKVCFLLSSDLVFTELYANDLEIPLREYNRVELQDFDPDLTPVDYARIKQNCRIYELVFDETLEWPEMINVRFKYHVNNSDLLSVFRAKKTSVQMNGTDFWYPRNLNRDENISLTVKTTDTTVFSLNGNAVDYVQTQNYAKEYKLDLTDSKDKPAVIIFQKKS